MQTILIKIQDTKELKWHLKLVQANPDGTPEHILEELIEDSKTVLSHTLKEKKYFMVEQIYTKLNIQVSNL